MLLIPSRVPAGKADQVALAVLYERHPLFPASFAELAVGVGEDQVRLGVDSDTCGAEVLGCRPDVTDPEVDQRAGCGLVEQQARVAEPEEREARRGEAGYSLPARDARGA